VQSQFEPEGNLICTLINAFRRYSKPNILSVFSPVHYWALPTFIILCSGVGTGGSGGSMNGGPRAPGAPE